MSVAKGQNASKLVVEAAADAPPGEHTLTQRAVAKFAGKDRVADIPLRIRIEGAAAK